MPITRTAMIDDDGSGTTGTILNNAWKQELYNQIDGAQTYGTFTPTDASGAGLAFQGGTQGKWAKYDRLVYVWLQAVYPATSNGANAKIGTLPYVVRTPAGGFQGFGPLRLWYAPEGTTVVEIRDTSGLPIANAAVSGANYIVNLVYLTD